MKGARRWPRSRLLHAEYYDNILAGWMGRSLGGYGIMAIDLLTDQPVKATLTITDNATTSPY